MAFLIHLLGDQGQQFKLGASDTIGRHPKNTLKFHDPIMSRSHTKIWRTDDGHYMIADLGSSHGTWVRAKGTSDFEKVSERLLVDGDRIIVGSSQFIFRKAGLSLDTRRWSVRTPCSLSVRVKIIATGESVETKAVDISPGGMLIDLKRKLEIGSEVKLAIEFPGLWRRINVKARVTHSGRTRGMGVAFLFASDRACSKLTVQIAQILVTEKLEKADT